MDRNNEKPIPLDRFSGSFYGSFQKMLQAQSRYRRESKRQNTAQRESPPLSGARFALPVNRNRACSDAGGIAEAGPHVARSRPLPRSRPCPAAPAEIAIRFRSRCRVCSLIDMRPDCAPDHMGADLPAQGQRIRPPYPCGISPAAPSCDPVSRADRTQAQSPRPYQLIIQTFVLPEAANRRLLDP